MKAVFETRTPPPAMVLHGPQPKARDAGVYLRIATGKDGADEVVRRATPEDMRTFAAEYAEFQMRTAGPQPVAAAKKTKG